MTSLVQKNELEDDDKMDLENSDNLILQNNDSNKNSTGQYKNSSSYRKTSKRRQIQQEKAVVLQIFKDLIKIVNQKFQNAYLSPPKNNKVPSKAPKMVKNASVKPSKKEENLKKKQQSVSAAINNHKVDEKSQSRELSQPAFPSFAQVNHTTPVTNNASSPQPFQSFSPSPHVVQSVRKSSEHASHRQKSQNEKPNVINVLKEALKKEIFENYSMEMKYIIHEEIEEQAEEVKPIDSGKMVEQSSENPTKRVHKSSKNFQPSENLDDLQVLSNEQECVGKFLEIIKHISEGQKYLINEESQKCEQEDQESQSSCEQNQKYPPHSHMPQGHASTTQQFLEQHHPIITTLPHSTQAILTQHKQHKAESNVNVQSHKKNQQ